MKLINSILVLALVIILMPSLSAQSVLGTWYTINKDTGEPDSEIVIEEVDGKARGYISKILSGKKNICKKCKGEKKNQPFEGLEIIWGFEKESEGKWVDGEILDPRNGKVYSCKMTVDGDDWLDVRGFIGSPLFGKTKRWKRKK